MVDFALVALEEVITAPTYLTLFLLVPVLGVGLAAYVFAEIQGWRNPFNLSATQTKASACYLPLTWLRREYIKYQLFYQIQAPEAAKQSQFFKIIEPVFHALVREKTLQETSFYYQRTYRPEFLTYLNEHLTFNTIFPHYQNGGVEITHVLYRYGQMPTSERNSFLHMILCDRIDDFLESPGGQKLWADFEYEQWITNRKL